MSGAIIVATSLGVITAVMVIALILLIRRLAVAGGRLPVTAEWIDDLSTERYRPMLRLLDNHDIECLRSCAGFTPQMASALRAQRCLIFRAYMRSLSQDFGRVCAALKIVMVQSRRDRPDLAAALVSTQARFVVLSAGISARLVLFRLGICSVDADELLRAFDCLRLELRTLIPSPVLAGA